MKTWRIRFVAALASALVLTGCSFDIYDLPLPGEQVSVEDGYEISADFADALNVVPLTSVMVGDVPVGHVVSVERVDWHARVTMRVRNDVVLPGETEAQIRQTSLLGEKYVELRIPDGASDAGVDAQSADRLGDGDVIALDRSGHNPEVEEVLGALSYLLSGGGIGQLQTITHELNQMMTGRTDEIQGVLRSLNDFVGTLDDQRDDIFAALESVNGLSQTLTAERDTISEAIEAAGPAIAVLQDQHEELVDLLVALDELGEVGTRVVDEISDDLVAALEHLEPVLRELANTDESLVPGLVAALGYPFPIDAANTIRGDFANVVFRLQFKLTPVSEGGLIPETLDDIIQLCRGLPTAPICSSVGDGVAQLCSVVPLLPLCVDQGLDEVTSALARVEQEVDSADRVDRPDPTDPSGTIDGLVPDALDPQGLVPDLPSGPGGLDIGFLPVLIEDLLGGGRR